MIVFAYSTLRDNLPPDFQCDLIGTSNRRQPGWGDRISAIMNWVGDFGKVQMTSLILGVLQHLERTQHIYQIDVSLGQTDAITRWATHSNSILGLPDQSLRDPKGAVLLGGENDQTDQSAALPYPPDARKRSAKHRQLLAGRGIAVMDQLPPSIGETEVVLRSTEEVGWRMLSLFIVAVRAESIASGNAIAVKLLREKSPMAMEALSPSEQRFLDDDAPQPQTVIDFVWRYESLYALQWALGLHADLKWPNAICDVPAVAETMVDRSDRELVTETRLRPTDEILDALDLNYQMLWAARNAQAHGRDLPANLDGGVLAERQHALNWLVQRGSASWDHVDTPS